MARKNKKKSSPTRNVDIFNGEYLYFWVALDWKGTTKENLDKRFSAKIREITSQWDTRFRIEMHPEEMSWRFLCHPGMLCLNPTALQMSIMRLFLYGVTTCYDDLKQESCHIDKSEFDMRIILFINSPDKKMFDRYYMEGHFYVTDHEMIVKRKPRLLQPRHVVCDEK